MERTQVISGLNYAICIFVANITFIFVISWLAGVTFFEAIVYWSLGFMITYDIRKMRSSLND